MIIKFAPVSEKLANVVVNGKESNWYVEKEGNFYNILWGRQDDLLSFREQSWFSSDNKQEIKEKLLSSVNKRVEFRINRNGIKYVYQGS